VVLEQSPAAKLTRFKTAYYFISLVLVCQPVLEKTKLSGKTGFFESSLPVLLVFSVNFAILLSTLLVIGLFLRNPNIPLQLDNSPRNFPIGSLTAVYAPDTQVFLDFSVWQSWYFLNAANFAVFLVLFLVLNWNLVKKERGIRFTFYSIVFLVLPVVANMLNLFLIQQSTLGPSGAYYTSNGLLVGFGLVNLWMGDAIGGWRKMTRRLDVILYFLNSTVATGFLLLSFVDPVDFFSEVVSGYNVGYGIHIFCFYSAVVLCLILGYTRRRSLAVHLLAFIDQTTNPS
jgi:hypothetical protein